MNQQAIDSNTNDKLRQMKCEFNPLSCCDGSVMFCQGATVVIVAVLGPVEVKTQNLIIDSSYLECNYRPKTGIPQVQDRIRETMLRNVLELALLGETYPRAKLSLQVQELEDRGSIDACSLNASCLGLLIGGLPLKYSFAAVHCIINDENEFVLDPDLSEIEHERASFLFAFDSIDGDLLLVQTKGAFKLSEFNDVECLCRAASKQIFQFYRSQLTNYHERSACTQKSAKKTALVEAMET